VEATVTVEAKDVEVFAPRVVVQKCLQNFVSNSIKHHDGESPQILIEARYSETQVTIAVTDDGPGIAPALHERVFGIFQTVRPRDEHETSGVGLAIVERLVKEHGATVQIESDGQRGCTMTLIWPHLESTSDAVVKPVTLEPFPSKHTHLVP